MFTSSSPSSSRILQAAFLALSRPSQLYPPYSPFPIITISMFTLTSMTHLDVSSLSEHEQQDLSSTRTLLVLLNRGIWPQTVDSQGLVVVHAVFVLKICGWQCSDGHYGSFQLLRSATILAVTCHSCVSPLATALAGRSCYQQGPGFPRIIATACSFRFIFVSSLWAVSLCARGLLAGSWNGRFR